MSDDVNHPAHYTRFPVEVIDITEHLNFCRGNAVKYISRAGAKDPAKELEDLQKAAWYIEREIVRLGGAATGDVNEQLATAWHGGFTACAHQHMAQRDDPTHAIRRDNPYEGAVTYE